MSEHARPWLLTGAAVLMVVGGVVAWVVRRRTRSARGLARLGDAAVDAARKLRARAA